MAFGYSGLAEIRPSQMVCDRYNVSASPESTAWWLARVLDLDDDWDTAIERLRVIANACFRREGIPPCKLEQQFIGAGWRPFDDGLDAVFVLVTNAKPRGRVGDFVIHAHRSGSQVPYFIHASLPGSLDASVTRALREIVAREAGPTRFAPVAR